MSESENDEKLKNASDDDGDGGRDDLDFLSKRTKELLEMALKTRTVLVWDSLDAPNDIIGQYNTGGDEDYIVFVPNNAHDYVLTRIENHSPGQRKFTMSLGVIYVYYH